MTRQQKLSFFSYLHRVISKVRFLIAFDLTGSLLNYSAASAAGERRRLRLERQPLQSPGLLECLSSLSAEPDDIDQQAEDFIERFYRQLRMERQVSLELKYCKGKDV